MFCTSAHVRVCVCVCPLEGTSICLKGSAVNMRVVCVCVLQGRTCILGAGVCVSEGPGECLRVRYCKSYFYLYFSICTRILCPY